MSNIYNGWQSSFKTLVGSGNALHVPSCSESFEWWGHSLLLSKCTVLNTELEPLRLVTVSVLKAWDQ